MTNQPIEVGQIVLHTPGGWIGTVTKIEGNLWGNRIVYLDDSNDQASRFLECVFTPLPDQTNVSICGYCQGEVSLTDNGWVHKIAGPRVRAYQRGDFVSAKHNQAGTRVNPNDVHSLTEEE